MTRTKFVFKIVVSSVHPPNNHTYAREAKRDPLMLGFPRIFWGHASGNDVMTQLSVLKVAKAQNLGCLDFRTSRVV